MVIRPSLSEIAANARHAWRLFLRDPAGAKQFGATPEDFWKSFFAAVVVLPGFALLLALTPNPARLAAPLPRLIPIELIAYTIGWCVWPLVVAPLSRWFNFEKHYIRYIVAYNWASIPQVSLMLFIVIIGQLFSLDQALFGILTLAAAIWLIAYHAFIVRCVLNPGIGVLLLLVVGELVAGQMILGVRDVLLMSPG